MSLGDSVVSPFYESGEYYDRHADYDVDGPFKGKEFLKIFLPVAERQRLKIASYADVGCGGGSAAVTVGQGLRDAGFPLDTVLGYEVSPHVAKLSQPGVEFRFEDFTKADVHVDVVTLFDVFEHVPDPLGFLRGVAERCHVMGLHIPLDDNIGNAVLNRFRGLMNDPGHLIFLDTASALTMVTMAGILIKDYRYTIPHRWPTGRGTLAQRLARPLRATLTFINPWLACKLVGGVSLMVVGLTPKGLRATS